MDNSSYERNNNISHMVNSDNGMKKNSGSGLTRFNNQNQNDNPSHDHISNNEEKDGGHSLELSSFGISHVGKKRENNEDSFYWNDSSGAYVVADGIGGNEGGEIASEIATSQIGKALSKFYGDEMKNLDVDLDDYFDSKDSNNIRTSFSKCFNDTIDKKMVLTPSYKTNTMRIKEAIANTNNLIIKEGQGLDFKNIGTTVTVVKCYSDSFFVSNIGDSRAYLWNNKSRSLFRLTKDDSLVEEMYRAGKISLEESKTHPQRNIITNFLGNHKLDVSKLEVSQYFWSEGDCVILCTDGLYNMVGDSEELSHYYDAIDTNNSVDDYEIKTNYQEYLNASNKYKNNGISKILDKNIDEKDGVQIVANLLVRKANENGGLDNITVVIVKNNSGIN
jgi:protein phosphatase